MFYVLTGYNLHKCSYMFIIKRLLPFFNFVKWIQQANTVRLFNFNPIFTNIYKWLLLVIKKMIFDDLSWFQKLIRTFSECPIIAQKSVWRSDRPAIFSLCLLKCHLALFMGLNVQNTGTMFSFMCCQIHISSSGLSLHVHSLWCHVDICAFYLSVIFHNMCQ